MPQLEPIEGQMQQLGLGAEADPETPESVRFRSLPQAAQRRLLLDYPRILATAMHQYSEGTDCEQILMQVFEGSSEMLKVRNSDGDNPMASALVRQQGERAEKLVDIAERRNPNTLDDRTQDRESLLMLSTSGGSSVDRVMERLLIREPTQLHRLYDNYGRNFLHHCALEESIEVLEAGLRITQRLIEEGRLSAGQVSAAIHMNDRAGDTVLHMMAARDRVDMLSLLVQFARAAGIDVNLDERQHRGNRWTPLMSAVSAGAARAAGFLLENGADPLETDSEGVTAEDLAENTPELKQETEFSDEMEVVEVDSDCDAVPEMTRPEPWLKPPQNSMRAVDSGFSSLSASESSFVSSDPKPDVEISETEVLEWESRLLGSGKTQEFLGALSRQDGQQTDIGLAFMSAQPISAAFSIWAAHGLCVKREAVLEAFKEVNKTE